MPENPGGFEGAYRKFLKLRKEKAGFRSLNIAALELRNAATKPEEEIIALKVWAKWCADEGSYPRAIAFLTDAVGLTDNPRVRAELHLQIAEYRFEVGDTQWALPALQRCFEEMELLDYRPLMQQEAERLHEKLLWHLANPLPKTWQRLFFAIKMTAKNIAGGAATMRSGRLDAW